MKLIKMLHPKSTLPLLLGMLLAASSFMSVAVANPSAVAASSGAVTHVVADPQRLMKDEYLYKETNDSFAMQFVFIGIGIAIFFTVVSIATGFGKNKS
ncbi:MAG: hypothetical protein COB94_010780 [Gammaproteobacteria bacterium]|nr:hypothetical protein [Gammaproteobacteria bacterium]